MYFKNERYINTLTFTFTFFTLSLVYQNATGVPNVTTVTNIPKMTKNDPNVPVFGSVHFYMGF